MEQKQKEANNKKEKLEQLYGFVSHLLAGLTMLHGLLQAQVPAFMAGP